MLTFNGVHARTGEYLFPRVPIEDLAAAITAGPPGDLEATATLRRVAALRSSDTLGLAHGVNPLRLDSAGWGLVCHSSELDRLRQALRPLLDLRQEQAGDLFKVLPYDSQTCRRWISEQGAEVGSTEERTIPYYLLLAGSPEQIPFEFEHQLALDYAVGRIAFDRDSDYTSYADSVRRHELECPRPRDPRVALFGTRHDRATELSADRLVRPLEERLRTFTASPAATKWTVCTSIAEAATKNELVRILSGAGDRPAIVFTATHGLGADPGDPEQAQVQGAVLCQDCAINYPIRNDHYLAAADVDASWDVAGMISFHFACYGGGTPAYDQFDPLSPGPPRRIADRPFVAKLPQALLAHPRGGTLACIAHIDRAWSLSFSTDGESTPASFQRSIGNLIAGEPVGFAIRDFRSRFAFLSVEVGDLIEAARLGATIPPKTLATAWLSRNDARAYTVLGDPAVRLKTDAS